MGITQGAAITWDLTKLYITESGLAPAEILPPGVAFDVNVDFDGSGPGWTALELATASYTVKFYAEGIGSAANELDLGTYASNLGAGPYTATLNVAAGIPTEGVYRLGCLIEISPGSGVVGFEENVIFSVATGA